jgi:hypothetical protein
MLLWFGPLLPPAPVCSSETIITLELSSLKMQLLLFKFELLWWLKLLYLFWYCFEPLSY